MKPFGHPWEIGKDPFARSTEFGHPWETGEDPFEQTLQEFATQKPGWQKFAEREEGYEKWGKLTPTEAAALAMPRTSTAYDRAPVAGAVGTGVAPIGGTATTVAKKEDGGADLGTGKPSLSLSNRGLPIVGNAQASYGMWDEDEARARLGQYASLIRGLGRT